MNPLKIIFMGTPHFAQVILERLLGSEHCVLLAITQPDRPKGRGNKLAQPPVKETAIAKGVPVLQPEKLNSDEIFAKCAEFNPDIIIIAAYGKILKKRLLELPHYGAVNVHASLLPRWRGASPIERAILSGDKESGVSIMQVAEKLDAGAVWLSRSIHIAGDERAFTLETKLAELGAEALLEAFDIITEGKVSPKAQDEALATYAPVIKKGDGAIDFKKAAIEIERMTRAYDPWPGAFTFLNKARLKIIEAEAIGGKFGEPGCIIENKNRLIVQCGEGMLDVKKLQLEGKKPMLVSEFLRGMPIEKDTVLGQ